MQKFIFAESQDFVNFRNPEMDEKSLFSYHDNQPVNKYFLLIFTHFGLKTTSCLNTYEKATHVKLAE